MKFRFLGAAALAAFALAGCTGEKNSSAGNTSGSSNQVAAGNESTNVSLPQIAAPNNGDWTQVVEETAENGYRMGNPEAPVKLIEYASITCHVCADFSEAAHAELVNDFVKSGQVSWEYRPYPIFPTDPGLFMLLRCQGPGPFFGLAEQLYATQREWVERAGPSQAQIQSLPLDQQPAAWVRATGLDQFFRQRGLPQGRMDQCLANREELQRLSQSKERGDREGVAGTPTFFINGEPAGVTAWTALKPLLRQAIGS